MAIQVLDQVPYLGLTSNMAIHVASRGLSEGTMTEQLEQPLSRSVTAAPVSGTPKKGVDCGRCDDWGTVVVDGPSDRPHEELCPAACAKAVQVGERRGWTAP